MTVEDLSRLEQDAQLFEQLLETIRGNSPAENARLVALIRTMNADALKARPSGCVHCPPGPRSTANHEANGKSSGESAS
jgi:hypothetical protein